MGRRNMHSLLCAIAACAATQGALAGTMTINLSQEFSGAAAPSGAGPWARAVLTDQGAGIVRLTMMSFLNSSNEFMAKGNGGWRFNLDPTKSATNLAFTHVSGEVSDGISLGTDQFKADGDGFFDIMISFAGGLEAGQANVVYDISIAGGGLSVASFNFVSVNGPPGKNGFLSAVHVQGIGNPSSGSGDSGWIADLPVVVPLPSAFGAGMVGLGLLGGAERLRTA